MDAGLNWVIVGPMVALLLGVMLLTEATWVWDRRLRRSQNDATWAATVKTIKSTLASPERQQVVEDARLSAILNQARLEQLCAATATALQAPAALVTVVEHEGQRWLAYYGADWCSPHTRVGLLEPLDTSYCQYVVGTRKTLVIEDSMKDRRINTAHPDAVKSQVRAYLGAPVYSGDVVVGSLCVFDNTPRKWTTRDEAFVESFASLVVL